MSVAESVAADVADEVARGVVTVENSVPADALLDPNGSPILDSNGQYILES